MKTRLPRLFITFSSTPTQATGRQDPRGGSDGQEVHCLAFRETPPRECGHTEMCGHV